MTGAQPVFSSRAVGRIVGLALAGCLLATAVSRAQSPPPAGERAEPAVPAQPPGPQVMYSCPGGADFAAAFSNDGELATLTVPGQPEVELSRQASGSGFAYTDSYYELRGRGREATLTAGGRSMRCHAVGRPGEPPRTYAGDGLIVTLFPDGLFRLRDTRTSTTPSFDLGQWAQEVDGGVRLVLRGGRTSKRTFSEVGNDRLVDENGTELERQVTSDPIDGLFRLLGQYRDTNNGSVFTECITGRSYEMAQSPVETELERTWTEVTPSRQAQILVELYARFGKGEILAERLVSMKREGTCPPPPPRSASLRDTEWRLVEIDNDKPSYDDWRQRPRLRLEDDGRYAGSAGCNTLAGTYQLDAAGLRFLPGATTQMACAPEVAAAEQRFLSVLSEIRQAQVSGITLDLLDGTGKRRLRFEARGR